MPGHVFCAVSRNRVLGDVVLSRGVAIRSAAPQIGFDIVTLGVSADGAGLRHAITVLEAMNGLVRVSTGASVARADCDRRAGCSQGRRVAVSR